MRQIPDPGFAGDDGTAPVELADVLSAYDAGSAGHLDVLRVVQRHRLLVPVVALLGEVEYGEDGLARDKTSDMATVLTRGRDGRLALLAFSGLDALARWDPQARPVPAGAGRVAAAAVQDGAAAIVLDVAGPVTFVIETDDVAALAGGYTLADVAGRPAWVRAAAGG